MAAGDLVVADYQFELRGFLFGAGTGVRVRVGSPSGFGAAPVKSQDTVLAHRPGSFGGTDLPGTRIVSFALYAKGSSPDAAVGLARQVETAFAASSSDVDLFGQLPGYGKFVLTGRPRGCDFGFESLVANQVEILALFHALDPTLRYL